MAQSIQTAYASYLSLQLLIALESLADDVYSWQVALLRLEPYSVPLQSGIITLLRQDLMFHPPHERYYQELVSDLRRMERVQITPEARQHVLSVGGDDGIGMLMLYLHEAVSLFPIR